MKIRSIAIYRKFPLITIIILTVFSTSCQKKVNLKSNKQKGLHVFAYADSIDYDLLRTSNVEWITWISWAYQKEHNSAHITHHNGDSVMIRRTDSAWVSQIKLIRSKGFKVFIKPHVWIYNHQQGKKWRSDIFHENTDDWNQWKNGYRDYILRYAKLAELVQAEMFCIGAELTKLSLEKPEFWRSLIEEVRTVYSGKLTYAANWDREYENIQFWDVLDYIGIQAYFPLTDNLNPTTAELSEGWHSYLPDLRAVSEKHNKQILFTELGYKSTSNAAIEPWLWEEYADVDTTHFSAETQARCYQAFFDSVWPESWFAGAHLWHLKEYRVNKDRPPDQDFNLYQKPALEIISKGFQY